MQRRRIFLLTAGLSIGCTAPSEGDNVETSAAPDTDGTNGAAGSETTGHHADHGGSHGASDDDTDDTDDDSAHDSSSGEAPVDIPEPIPDDCITDVTPGHHVFSCGGFDFDVEVPPACVQTQCGLVVDVHGYTMDAAMQDKNTNLRALAAARGYIAVQPNANPAPPNSSWNVEDDAAVFDFTLRTIAAFHVDDRRVHLTGFSQGGFMTWRMLCDYSDTFASVAPGAACGTNGVALGCAPDQAQLSAKPDVLYIHGLTDVLVPYPGCAEPQRDSVLAAYEMTEGPETVADEANYRWQRWTSADGAVFEMIDHDYAAVSAILGGHCFPGSPDTKADLPGQLLSYGCNPVSPLHYGEAVMNFFEAHPKPQ